MATNDKCSCCWYRWIKGVLESDSWVVTAENLTGWDGECVFEDKSPAPAGQVTLNGRCIEPLEGLAFVAVFNDVEEIYEVVTICCPS